MKNIPCDFIAIDFEHATEHKYSVCAVGIVSITNEKITDEYPTLIQPPNNEYSAHNSLIHGIGALKTEKQPTFDKIYPEIRSRLQGNIVVAHNAFSTDKPCLEQSMSLYGIEDNLDLTWKCTYQIFGYSLNVIAKA